MTQKSKCLQAKLQDVLKAVKAIVGVQKGPREVGRGE